MIRSAESGTYDQQSLVSSLEPCAFNGARRAPGDWKPGQVRPTPLSQHQYAILNHCEANQNCMNSHVRCIHCIEIPILRTWSVNQGLSHQHSQGGHRWIPNCKLYIASMLNSGKLHVFQCRPLLHYWIGDFEVLDPLLRLLLHLPSSVDMSFSHLELLNHT